MFIALHTADQAHFVA